MAQNREEGELERLLAKARNVDDIPWRMAGGTLEPAIAGTILLTGMEVNIKSFMSSWLHFRQMSPLGLGHWADWVIAWSPAIVWASSLMVGIFLVLLITTFPDFRLPVVFHQLVLALGMIELALFALITFPLLLTLDLAVYLGIGVPMGVSAFAIREYRTTGRGRRVRR